MAIAAPFTSTTYPSPLPTDWAKLCSDHVTVVVPLEIVKGWFLDTFGSTGSFSRYLAEKKFQDSDLVGKSLDLDRDTVFSKSLTAEIRDTALTAKLRGFTKTNVGLIPRVETYLITEIRKEADW